MSMNVDLQSYQKFVTGVASPASKDFQEFLAQLKRLHDQGCEIQMLDTAFTGLNSEAGEAFDLVKKLKFQGKDWTDDIKNHLARELGDIQWYWILACQALGVDPNSIIEDNVAKLQARYPGGVFDVHCSERRKTGDI